MLTSDASVAGRHAASGRKVSSRRPWGGVASPETTPFSRRVPQEMNSALVLPGMVVEAQTSEVTASGYHIDVTLNASIVSSPAWG